MADQQGSRSNTPAAAIPGDDDGFPQYPAISTGPPSIISSRMTDIGTEDGREGDANNTQKQEEGLSVTGTAKSAASPSQQRGPAAWPQPTPLRRGLSGKRASLAGSTGGSSIGGNRPASSASRTHVPSVSSHAFFRPMSSQKLQAQRNVARPPTMSRYMEVADDGGEHEGASVIGANVIRHSIQSQTPSGRHFTDEPPPSRGTEMSGRETFDRNTYTARTMSTGHYPSESVAESERPLHKKAVDENGNTGELNDNHDNRRQASPGRLTPHSLKSSLMLRNESGSKASTNRNKDGAEKLGSVDSNPQYAGDGPEFTPEKSAKAPAPAMGRNWEYFVGNTVFCMGGRLQNTRSRPINIATGGFVVVPCVLFFVFSARELWYEISPAVPIVFAYLTFICLSSFLHASVTDPGILPRNLHQNPPPDVDEDPLRLAPPSTDWTLIKSAESSTSAMEVPTKYCKTCQIWRPPRTHHCRVCDNCVETADHHCVWLNNCVGRRNYRYFFAFVSSCTVLALYLVGASLAQILVYMNRQGVTFRQAINHDAVPFAMVIYGFIAFIYPAALMTYHLFLMARGETTREFLNSHKFLKKDRFRTFTQGTWYRNWIVVLCRPRPPTYYHFKKRYNVGDQRLADTKTKERRRKQSEKQQQDGVELSNIPSRGFQGPAALRSASAQRAESGQA